MVDYRINVIVDSTQSAKGTAEVEKQLINLGTATTRLNSLIQGALSFIGLDYGIRALVQLADAYTNAQNRIRTVTDSNIQLEVVMDRVFDIASKTGVALDTVVNVYQRTAAAAKNLGLSQQQFLDFTRGLSEEVVISGASAQQASAGLLQIAQGMGSATITGRELRAIIHDLPGVAQLLADELNRLNPNLNATTGSLKGLVAQGKITPKTLIDAVLNPLQAIDAAFEKTSPTISRAIQTLRTNLVQMLGDFNKNTGAQGQFASIILFVAHNVDIFGRAILAVSIVLGVNFAINAVGKAIKALNALRIAFITNPLVAWGNVLLLLATLLIAFGDKIQLGGGHVANFQDLAVAAWQDIKDAAEIMYNWFATYFPKLTKFIGDAFGGGSWAGYITSLAVGIDAIVTLFLGLGSAIATALSNIPASFKLIFKEAFNGIFSIMETSLNYIIDAINKASEKLGHVAQLAHVTIKPFDTGAENTALNTGPADAFAAQLRNPSTSAQNAAQTLLAQADAVHKKNAAAAAAHKTAYDAAAAALNTPGNAIQGPAGKLDTFDAIIAKIRGETDALQLNKQARAVADEEVKVEYQLKQKLSPVQKELLDQAYQDFLLQKQKTAILDQLRGPQEDLIENTKALNELLAEGAINQDQYNQELNKFSQAALAANRDLTSGLQRGLLQIQEQFGNVAQLASQTLVGAFQKAEDALVQFATTGKLNFRDLVTSIITDLDRLAIRQAITAPIANFLGIGGSNSIQGGLVQGLGGAGGLASLFGSQGSIARLAQTGSSDFVGPLQQSSFFGNIGSLLGFATGGSFMVGGSGAVDSKIVGFRATPGEMVNIQKPGSSNDNSPAQSNSGPPTVINFNISTPDAQSFKKSQSQMAAQAARIVSQGRRNS